ncbi:MAG: hypothetical protein ACAH06_06420 [Methylophilaceae bacterium]|jgi:hypothetical protein
MPYQPHSKASLEAALAYSRWLHQAEFIRWQNTYRREFGLPTETPPVCLNTVGKRVYEDIRRRICVGNRNGSVLTSEGERKAVVAEIISGLNEGGV